MSSSQCPNTRCPNTNRTNRNERSSSRSEAQRPGPAAQPKGNGAFAVPVKAPGNRIQPQVSPRRQEYERQVAFLEKIKDHYSRKFLQSSLGAEVREYQRLTHLDDSPRKQSSFVEGGEQTDPNFSLSAIEGTGDPYANLFVDAEPTVYEAFVTCESDHPSYFDMGIPLSFVRSEAAGGGRAVSNREASAEDNSLLDQQFLENQDLFEQEERPLAPDRNASIREEMAFLDKDSSKYRRLAALLAEAEAEAEPCPCSSPKTITPRLPREIPRLKVTGPSPSSSRLRPSPSGSRIPVPVRSVSPGSQIPVPVAGGREQASQRRSPAQRGQPAQSRAGRCPGTAEYRAGVDRPTVPAQQRCPQTWPQHDQRTADSRPMRSQSRNLSSRSRAMQTQNAGSGTQQSRYHPSAYKPAQAPRPRSSESEKPRWRGANAPPPAMSRPPATRLVPCERSYSAPPVKSTPRPRAALSPSRISGYDTRPALFQTPVVAPAMSFGRRSPSPAPQSRTSQWDQGLGAGAKTMTVTSKTSFKMTTRPSQATQRAKQSIAWEVPVTPQPRAVSKRARAVPPQARAVLPALRRAEAWEVPITPPPRRVRASRGPAPPPPRQTVRRPEAWEIPMTPPAKRRPSQVQGRGPLGKDSQISVTRTTKTTIRTPKRSVSREAPRAVTPVRADPCEVFYRMLGKIPPGTKKYAEAIELLADCLKRKKMRADGLATPPRSRRHWESPSGFSPPLSAVLYEGGAASTRLEYEPRREVDRGPNTVMPCGAFPLRHRFRPIGNPEPKLKVARQLIDQYDKICRLESLCDMVDELGSQRGE